MARKRKKKSLVGYMLFDLWDEYTSFEESPSSSEFWVEVAIAKKKYRRQKPNWKKVRITIEEI